MSRLSIHKLRELKANGQRFAMITAYDYPSARLVEQAGVPVILVGDSLGSVILGYESTVPVTMDDVVYHTRAVVRGTSKAIVVADLPFMSYQANADEAIRNAGRLLQEGGATAVKLEGGSHVVPLVRRMVECGIPVAVRGGTVTCTPAPRAMFDAQPRPRGEFVDAGRTGLIGLQVRSWQRGDAFMPLGMRRRKKLSDLFIDAGVPAHDKHRTPVLTTADGTIVWVCGLRIDDRFKVTDSTTDVLRLQFQREKT